MPKKDIQEEKKQFEVSLDDIKKLRAGLAANPGNKLYPSFYMTMVAWGHAKIEHNDFVVTDPDIFSHYNRVMSKIENYDYHKFKEALDTVPGEREAFLGRLGAFKASLGDLVGYKTYKPPQEGD